MSRSVPYTGPSGFRGLGGVDADEMMARLHAFELLGDCDEEASEAELTAQLFYLSAPLALLSRCRDSSEKAERELISAVRLSRYQGASWQDIGSTLGLSAEDAHARFGTF